MPALTGHPFLFRSGNVTTPIELVQQHPKLLLTKEGGKTGVVRLKLDPAPKSQDIKYQIIEDTPQRVVFVAFDKKHHTLAGVLGEFLDVPASEADRVVEAAEALSGIATLHSEVGGSKATETKADTRLHLHLFPYQSGLRAEFFVRPLGEGGPFLRPGHGGENVFATIDEKPCTTRRNLTAEESARVHFRVPGPAAVRR